MDGSVEVSMDTTAIAGKNQGSFTGRAALVWQSHLGYDFLGNDKCHSCSVGTVVEKDLDINVHIPTAELL